MIGFLTNARKTERRANMFLIPLVARAAPFALLRLLKGILNEITDQNAYQRHLAALGVEASGAEWRKFCDERWKAKAGRCRCC